MIQWILRFTNHLVTYACSLSALPSGKILAQIPPRAGRYDGIIVIPQYVNSPMLIPKLFVLYDFIVIDIIAI